jgi:hypothetical protein
MITEYELNHDFSGWAKLRHFVSWIFHCVGKGYSCRHQQWKNLPISCVV